MTELVSLVPPPENPLEVPTTEQWGQAESILCRLPDDYKEFLSQYGTGVLDEFLWVYNPATNNRYLNLISQADVVLSALQETSSKFPDLFPMRRFPEPGGLLPFAGTDNGDNLFWVTKGEPCDWTIAVMGARSPDCYYHNTGFVDFLVSLIKQQTRCQIFPGDFPDAPPLSFYATIG